MPLETATFTSDFVTSNPAASDGMNNADDHMRLIKQVVKNTLAGVNSALSRVIGTTFGFLSGDGTAAAPAYSFTTEPTLGFWRSAAGVMTAQGQLRSTVEVGKIDMFAMATAPAGWVACDGQTLARVGQFADLFAVIGTTWGTGAGDGLTFSAPDLRSYFPRHRDSNTLLANTVGTKKAPKNLAHTHAVNGSTTFEDAVHQHNFNVNTSVAGGSHSHTYPLPSTSGNQKPNGTGTAPFDQNGPGTGTTGVTSIDHVHNVSGTTSNETANHQHSVSLTSGGGSQDDANEARPFSATLLFCIKF